MRLSIKRHNIYIAEFQSIDIYGRRALGGAALTLTLRGSTTPSEKVRTIHNLSLSIEADDGSIAAAHIPSERIFHTARPEGGAISISFVHVFGNEQIDALDRGRHGGDLKLKLGLRSLTFEDSLINEEYDATQIVIPRQKWLEELDRSGFRKTILLEIPLHKGFEEVLSLASKAQEFISIGHYNDAVMQCRRALDFLDDARGDRSIVSAARKKYSNGEREGMNIRERLLVLRETTKNVAQLGAHGTEEFTAWQAKAILGATISILSDPSVGLNFTNDE